MGHVQPGLHLLDLCEAVIPLSISFLAVSKDEFAVFRACSATNCSARTSFTAGVFCGAAVCALARMVMQCHAGEHSNSD